MMMVFLRSIRWLRAHLGTLFMLQALLLPVYGPWLDYRFAGLQPQHDHIYFGKADPDHHAPAHAHQEATEHLEDDEEAPFPLKGVVNLPDKEMIWQGLLLLICTFNLFFLLPKETLFFSVVTVIHKIQSILVLPLTPPPRL